MKNNIKNLKITKKVAAMALAGTLATAVLTGCESKQVLLNKSFNVAIETNNGYVSIAAIKGYSDYTGSQVQFLTEDGLFVLTSTHQTQFLKEEVAGHAENYAFALSGMDQEKVMNYNEMQGITINNTPDSSNKNIFDLNYTYNKAIILTDEIATIVEINSFNSWKDYGEDDKIQLQLTNGMNILTTINNVKLINDSNAKEDSLFNYAVSLVGSEENVVKYTYKTKIKNK